MHYPEFRAQGLCTSTGVVEAGCKTAIGTRLKRAGMHWSVAGADAIIALRCCKLSGRFEDFWERRSDAARAVAGYNPDLRPPRVVHSWLHLVLATVVFNLFGGCLVVASLLSTRIRRTAT